MDLETLDDLIQLLAEGYPLPAAPALAVLREQQKVQRALSGEDIPALLADARRWREAVESMSVLPPPQIAPPVYISTHAIDRYREHYPGATLENARADLASSVEVPPETAIVLLGRAGRQPHPGKYYLSRERRGLWATSDLQRIRTYLRLGQSQQDFARKHWP